MTTLREAAQQALEYLDAPSAKLWPAGTQHRIITALRAALAEPVQEPDLSRCPKCGGPADNGHDRCLPPNPYHCTKCEQEDELNVAFTLGLHSRRRLTDAEVGEVWFAARIPGLTETHARLLIRAAEEKTVQS